MERVRRQGVVGSIICESFDEDVNASMTLSQPCDKGPSVQRQLHEMRSMGQVAHFVYWRSEPGLSNGHDPSLPIHRRRHRQKSIGEQRRYGADSSDRIAV